MPKRDDNNTKLPARQAARRPSDVNRQPPPPPPPRRRRKSIYRPKSVKDNAVVFEHDPGQTLVSMRKSPVKSPVKSQGTDENFQVNLSSAEDDDEEEEIVTTSNLEIANPQSLSSALTRNHSAKGGRLSSGRRSSRSRAKSATPERHYLSAVTPISTFLASTDNVASNPRQQQGRGDDDDDEEILAAARHAYLMSKSKDLKPISVRLRNIQHLTSFTKNKVQLFVVIHSKNRLALIERRGLVTDDVEIAGTIRGRTFEIDHIASGHNDDFVFYTGAYRGGRSNSCIRVVGRFDVLHPDAPNAHAQLALSQNENDFHGLAVQTDWNTLFTTRGGKIIAVTPIDSDQQNEKVRKVEIAELTQRQQFVHGALQVGGTALWLFTSCLGRLMQMEVSKVTDQLTGVTSFTAVFDDLLERPLPVFPGILFVHPNSLQILQHSFKAFICDGSQLQVYRVNTTNSKVGTFELPSFCCTGIAVLPHQVDNRPCFSAAEITSEGKMFIFTLPYC